MESSDRELVRAACGGDVESFRELYERHYRMIVAIARSRLPDQHLAEDAAQETFAVACQQLATLRNPDRFPEWLGTICRRTASWMQRSRPTTVSLESDPPETSTHDDGDQRLVRQAVAGLPALQREIIHLRYYSGLSYEQIAKAIGVTPQAVHGRLQRARRELTRRLAETNHRGDA